MSDFRALVLREDGGKVTSAIETVNVRELPDADVLVRVTHSTLNYKDGMVLNGIGRLVRSYPHIPGVDFAGIVEESAHPAYAPGDSVVLTGWRVGEVWWGGYAERARVRGDWLIRLPDGLALPDAMALGTAGFTAMLAIRTLEAQGLTQDAGEVLVTGAAGGVGSVATAILAHLGYRVVASTGRPAQADYLSELGATRIVERAELAAEPQRPLARETYAAAIDNVGGTTLANLLTQVAYGGSVAAVGLAGGNTLSTTVLPFLLRGVSLLGIDSVMCPAGPRQATWDRLAQDLPIRQLRMMVETRALTDLPQLARDILAGQVRGRVVIDLADQAS